MVSNTKKNLSSKPATAESVPVSPGLANPSNQIEDITSTIQITKGNLSTHVVTLGANGTTMSLAKELQTMAHKMIASKDLSQDEANKILALANQGFRLAELEKLVEDSAKTGTPESFLASTITFEGKTMTIPEVAGIIGFGTPTDPNQDIASSPEYMLDMTDASPETLTFLKLYQDALSSPGIQKSASAKGTISQLSSQISYLSDSVSNLIYGANDFNMTLENLTGNLASTASTYDSTAICYMGNGCSSSNPTSP